MKILTNLTKKLYLTTLISTTSLCCLAEINNYNVGIGYGSGSPNDLYGYRLNLRTPGYYHDMYAILPEISVATWKTSGIHKYLNITAIAPIIKIYALNNNDYRISLEASIGLAYRDNLYTGNYLTGSHWTFQDKLGIAFAFGRVELRIHWVHYSNASISPPNPGTDVKPLISVAFYVG